MNWLEGLPLPGPSSIPEATPKANPPTAARDATIVIATPPPKAPRAL